MLKGILSLRGATRYYFYHVIFEWEDALSETLNIPLKRMNPFRKILLQRRKKEVVLKNNTKEDYYIAFIMNVESLKIYSGYNVIPVICDVFRHTAEKLYNQTRDCEVFYVTGYGIYKYLKNNFKCNKVRYIPLTCPDFFLSEFEHNYKTYPIYNRTIDVLQYGRRNEKLHEWMCAYVKMHPDVDYLYRDGDYKCTTYVSTKSGRVYEAPSRSKLNQLMHSSKIAFVSARGKDEKEGELYLDFVTPRVFEVAAAGCHMVGRYSDNKEKEIYGLDLVCRIPESYEEFGKSLDELLKKHTVDEGAYKEFLNRNRTSVRFKEYFNM